MTGTAEHQDRLVSTRWKQTAARTSQISPELLSPNPRAANQVASMASKEATGTATLGSRGPGRGMSSAQHLSLVALQHGGP